jgi:dipeptidyl aminopeptidase/acylaminoacyl peptidase
MLRSVRILAAALAITLLVTWTPKLAAAQGTLADYQRAADLRDRFDGLVVNAPEPAVWIGETHRFWYRKTVRDGNVFVLVDADARQKRPAFDHDLVAQALSADRDTTFTNITLPFDSIGFTDDELRLEFVFADSVWQCPLTDSSCRAVRRAPERRRFERADGDEEDDGVRLSPDSTREAFIRNHNVWVRAADSEEEGIALSTDGSEGDAYVVNSIRWAPGSDKLVAYRVRPGYERLVHYVESSPDDQRQPKHFTRQYTKPGDVLDVERPVLFHLDSEQQFIVDNELFPNAYSMSDPEWREDGRAFTFEYNQRGHQVYRVIEVDARTAEARAVISEEPETFFYYREANGSQRDSGKKFRYDLDDGRDVIWMSERDGWSHLYMYDGNTGRVKHQITSGEWVVRSVEWVDEANRQIWFRTGGMHANHDPYFVHYYRIDMDGGNLTALTEANGNHTVSFSADRELYVDHWSRVDMAPVAQLRRTDTRETVMELERGDMSALLAAGWQPPEVFVSKARDGVTDIWGVIIRPTTFDSTHSYPVIESIYAGPQGSFVPKDFSVHHSMRAQAELGFIVVQIDGMGTNNRSKAFHDVAWKNLGDAGFPDRIRWHQAVASRYAWYDTTRVGIYGGSAGGQNAMGALLFHPEFYHVAVSSVGCHDNRMDKIWWNELWMSWPIGPQYDASSNVVNAHRLQGKLLLVVGELDTNVDPASTYQVADALIEAGKDFDFLMIPGAGHGSGGEYGERRRFDFFVEHLLGARPPDWNAGAALVTADAGES